MQERERFFYVPCEKFVPVTISMEDAELSRFRGYRWWPISEVKCSSDRFVPAKLGELLEDLHTNGPSTEVIETGE